ncbi:hypothetical protein [Bacteroides caecimuris]|uniref:hypothetical protein n=1 Tax=Bacteroides caecimuris TaxID=1796613 RepID=UPI00265D513D|nr:hypothetical protein [Bacteroides caecimuris]
MQAFQLAKIDNADAKVTGCKNANCRDCEGCEGREEKPFLYLFTENTYQTDDYHL